MKFKVGDEVTIIHDDTQFNLINKIGHISKIVNASAYKYKVYIANENIFYFFTEDELEITVSFKNEQKLKQKLGLT